MNEPDKTEFSRWLQTADKRVFVQSDELAKQLVANRRFRTRIVNRCLGGLGVAAVVLAGMFAWPFTTGEDSAIETSNNFVVAAAVDNHLVDHCLEFCELQQQLDESRANLKRLNEELSELRERRFAQQFVLLKEQVSQSGIDAPSIAIIGF